METDMSNTKDSGRIRMGAGCRIVAAASTKDTGRIRVGAGCRVVRSK
jgi:hypothetical protein